MTKKIVVGHWSNEQKANNDSNWYKRGLASFVRKSEHSKTENPRSIEKNLTFVN